MQNAMFLYFFDDFGALWYKSFQKTSSPQVGEGQADSKQPSVLSEGTFLAYVPLRSASEAEARLRFLAPMRATGIRKHFFTNFQVTHDTLPKAVLRKQRSLCAAEIFSHRT